MVTAIGGRGGAADRLLPQGRLSGPMPWVIAIMIFLTVIAGAAGIALNQSAATIGEAVANRLTIQVIEPEAEARDAIVARLAKKLSTMPGVTKVAVVPRTELMRNLEPWLGTDLDAAQIPVPALIDVDLHGTAQQSDAAARAITDAARAISPETRTQAHAAYLAPVATLVSTIGWIAIGIVALMVVATGCVVVLAAKGAHATHRGTIEVMHMLGATDGQVMRLFQRRMTRDVSFGAIVGLLGALVLVGLVGRSAGLMAGDLIGSVALPSWGWIVLPLLPVLFIAVAWVAARMTLLRALSRSL